MSAVRLTDKIWNFATFPFRLVVKLILAGVFFLLMAPLWILGGIDGLLGDAATVEKRRVH
jgi:hypothetical protein